VHKLAIRLLAGPGYIDLDGVASATLGSRKARSLLWLLAVARGAFVSSETLAEALWADDPPARPADQVAVLVSRLRAVLGRDRIERGDAGYRLRYDWLDADEVDALTTETQRRADAGNVSGAAAAARVSVSLLRAPPTGPDLAGPRASEGLADLDRLVARARRVAAGALLSSGAWLESVDVATDALAGDPYDEDALRAVMRANVAGGRTAAALAIYATAAERMADDLGADPSAQTKDLHTAILRGELDGADAPVSGPLPGAVAVVGRDRELAALRDAAARARRGDVQVVVVEGEAGIGKTALVRAFTRQLPRTDVVLFGSCAELGRSAPLDPLLGALAACLRSLGPEQARDVLGADAPVMAPLVGFAAAGSAPPLLADGVVGPTLVYSALASVLGRLAGTALLVAVLDDLHRAGSALVEWLEFVRTRRVPLLVVATVRTPQLAPVTATDVLRIGPLNAEQVADIVGAARGRQLFERSGGNPLFLTELALASDSAGLPASLVEAVSTRCDGLGRAADLLRAAAVVGDRVDPDLLAAVLNRPAVQILDDCELAVAHHLLVDDAGTFRFRHALVRDALAVTASAGRSAWLHRQVAWVLEGRPDADPAEVADHARRGGDLPLAAQSLRAVAARAAERFDHATAEAVLDDALTLHAEPQTWLERARIRTRRGDYTGAYRDVERARPTGASALEVGAWASYFDRRFEQAAAFAADGAALADDDTVRARCQTVAGRTEHARGDLAAAEELLSAGTHTANGADRMIASAWLGVLRSHQSRPADALALLRPATHPGLRAEHTSAILHALLFSGHAHALAGRPASALEFFGRYDTEVARRHVGRFTGRGTNFAGWVLRNIAATSEGVDLHQQALEAASTLAGPETRVAALEDLAEAALATCDVDAASALLEQAAAALHGDLVFGWRLRFKLDLLRARTALAYGDAAAALGLAATVAADATRLAVPRYAAPARLVLALARAASGEPVDLSVVESDLLAVQSAVALEAWWWTGECAAALHVPAWMDLCSSQVADLAGAAGERADGFRSRAAPRLDAWKAAAG